MGGEGDSRLGSKGIEVELDEKMVIRAIELAKTNRGMRLTGGNFEVTISAVLVETNRLIGCVAKSMKLTGEDYMVTIGPVLTMHNYQGKDMKY